MRRIRLALVAGTLDESADRQLDLLARQLHARSYDVSLYRLAASRHDAGERACGMRVANFDSHFRYDPRIILGLADDLAQVHADIVYTWGDAADTCGRIAAIKSGTAVVMRASLGNLPQPALHRGLGRVLSRWTQAHVTFSGGMARHLIESGLAADRVHMIHPGIETGVPVAPGADALQGDLPELPEGARLVLAAGSIDRHQGLLRLLWAMGIIRYSGLKAHLWVVGTGQDVGPLQHQAEMMGIGSLIHFIGQRDDLPQLLQRAGAFAMPTRHEVLNMAPLQAMLQRVPVVLANSPGAVELSANGRCALLTDAEHPKDIASAIYRQLCDTERVGKMTEEAVRHVTEHYSAKQFVDRHDELMRQLVAQKGVDLSH